MRDAPHLLRKVNRRLEESPPQSKFFFPFRSQAAEAQLSLDSAAYFVGSSDSKPGQVLSGHRYLL